MSGLRYTIISSLLSITIFHINTTCTHTSHIHRQEAITPLHYITQSHVTCTSQQHHHHHVHTPPQLTSNYKLKPDNTHYPTSFNTIFANIKVLILSCTRTHAQAHTTHTLFRFHPHHTPHPNTCNHTSTPLPTKPTHSPRHSILLPSTAAHTPHQLHPLHHSTSKVGSGDHVKVGNLPQVREAASFALITQTLTGDKAK